MELAGVQKQALKLTTAPNRIKVRGKRERPFVSVQVQHLEIQYGYFETEFAIPEIYETTPKVYFEQGVLCLVHKRYGEHLDQKEINL